MSTLLAGYGSSDDEVQPVSSTSGTSKRPAPPAVPDADDDESDDEKLEAQARTDAFGLSETNGSKSQSRTDNGKLVVASAPDVLREVSQARNAKLPGEMVLMM
jgi:pre-mRNA-processing factor 17